MREHRGRGADLGPGSEWQEGSALLPISTVTYYSQACVSGASGHGHNGLSLVLPSPCRSVNMVKRHCLTVSFTEDCSASWYDSWPCSVEKGRLGPFGAPMVSPREACLWEIHFAMVCSSHCLCLSHFAYLATCLF